MTALHTDEWGRFAKALAEARQRAGLTQYQLADRLGIRQDVVSKCEGGRRRLDVVEFLRWVRAIGVDPKTIFEAVGDPGRF